MPAAKTSFSLHSKINPSPMQRTLFLLILFFSTHLGFSQAIDSVESATLNTKELAADSLVIVVSLVKKDTLSIIGVGDIMMGTNYPEPSKLPPDNGSFLMRGVKSILQDADLTFGNLEGVLLDAGGTPKSCRDPKVCYVFRSPVAYVQNLVDAGFDVMSLANNHAGDFGDVGRKSSMATLEDAGIVHAGQSTNPYTIFTKDSITYGFTAFAPNSGCNNINDTELARSIVTHLDSLCDVVIVSFHGGAEGSQYQQVPRKHEIFHGEDRGDVYAFAHDMIDHGADIIFGHGPHVTRSIDIYKNRFITYSMGNFCTYRGINVAGVNGLAPIIKLTLTNSGEFISGKIIPTYQNYGAGVQVDDEKRVVKVIQDLTRKDFPESGIRIDDNGIINYIAQ